MTPEEHRTEAEEWILAAHAAGGVQNALMALAHATLAQAPEPPPAQSTPTVDIKRAIYVLTFTGELIEVSRHPDGGLYLGCDTPDGDWSALITDPTQVRLMADALTAHAQRMENNR